MAPPHGYRQPSVSGSIWSSPGAMEDYVLLYDILTTTPFWIKGASKNGNDWGPSMCGCPPYVLTLDTLTKLCAGDDTWKAYLLKVGFRKREESAWLVEDPMSWDPPTPTQCHRKPRKACSARPPTWGLQVWCASNFKHVWMKSKLTCGGSAYWAGPCRA
jgi:hypothetical protein